MAAILFRPNLVYVDIIISFNVVLVTITIARYRCEYLTHTSQLIPSLSSLSAFLSLFLIILS